MCSESSRRRLLEDRPEWRVRTRSAGHRPRPSPLPEPESGSELRMPLQLLPQALEVARPQRDRPAPRGPVGGVGEADEALALLALEELDERCEPLVARPLLERQLVDHLRLAPRRRGVLGHEAHRTWEPVTRL